MYTAFLQNSMGHGKWQVCRSMSNFMKACRNTRSEQKLLYTDNLAEDKEVTPRGLSE